VLTFLFPLYMDYAVSAGPCIVAIVVSFGERPEASRKRPVGKL